MSAPATAPARTREAGLQRNVLAHANAVYRRLSGPGLEAAAERLAAEAARFDDDETEVVVAGDIKRGKSSLVNVLVDAPGLLPVDADVATSVHLAVIFGDTPSASVWIVDEDTGERSPHDIPVSELGDYSAIGGRHAGEVKSAVVRVPHPLLRNGLSLVDTPGVGGMTRGHRDITMSALARADVLLFTVSAQEPVSRTELEFLTEASERIGNVILVVTRSDLVTAEQRDAHVADIRARIVAHAAAAGPTVAARVHRLADAPVLVTSAYVAEQGLRRAERGQADRAVQLAESSGVPVVRAHLERSVEAKKLLRMANVLQLVDVLLTARIASARARVAAADGDETSVDQLSEARARLEHAASQQARWRTGLANGFARFQAEVGRDVGRELTIVRDNYRTALDGEGSERLTVEDLHSIRSQLGDSLAAAWSNLAGHATRHFEDIVLDLLEQLALEAEPGLLGEFAVPPVLTAGVDPAVGAGRFSAMDDGLPLAMQTFMFSNITNALLGVLGVATGGIGLLAYGVGAALATPVMLMRRKQRERKALAGSLLREIGDALFGQEGVAREFTTELTLRTIAAREQLEALIETRLTDRRKELEAELQELTRVLKSEQGVRRQARQEAERDLAELQTLSDQTTAFADSVAERLRTILGGDVTSTGA